MKVETYVTSIESGTEYGYQLTSDNGDFIMDVVLGGGYAIKDDIEKQFEKHRPLVTMMAAAPDLLAALEDLLDLAEPMCVEQEDFTLVQARKAIAKAKGETQ